MAGNDVQKVDDADALWLPSSYGESVEQVDDHCWLYDCWISYYYRILCAYFKKKPGRSQNLQRSTEHMVDIFHVCTYPTDGNNYHKGNNQYISVFVNQVHHTTIEYRNQYLRTNLQISDINIWYSISGIQISIYQYANIIYSI